MKLIDKGGFYIAETAVVQGDVTLHEGVSVWHFASIRGDMAPITVGKYSNIQDGCVLHCDPGEPLDIGEHVTVGHQAMIHCAKIGDNCLIGIQCVLLAGAEVGEGSIVAAGAMVKEGQKIPPGSLVVGVPARIRSMKEPITAEAAKARSMNYHETALRHVRGEIKPL